MQLVQLVPAGPRLPAWLRATRTHFESVHQLKTELRGLGNQAVSSGMSFASTYALGHVAKRYYAGGRTLSAQTLKDAFSGVVKEGQNLQTQYLPAIQEKARTLDAGKVLSLVRGA